MLNQLEIKKFVDQIKAEQLESLDIEDLEIDNLGVQEIASVLATNTSLLRLRLKINSKEDPTIAAQAMVQALACNTTLQELVFHCDEMWPSKIALNLAVEIMLGNFNLRKLNLNFDFDHRITLSDGLRLRGALSKNYTLLEFEAISSIDMYEELLKRNKTIHKYLSNFEKEAHSKSLVEVGHLSDELRWLRSCIKDISFADAPIAEIYRLWSGMSDIANSKDIENGFTLLNPPFHHPDLQQAADRARAHALSTSPCFENTEVEYQAARYRLMLYYLRHSFRESTASTHFKAALMGLKHPDQARSADEAKTPILTLVGADVLLSYDDVLHLAEKARQTLSHPDDVAYLERLSNQETYDSGICEGFWQSPTFRRQLQHDYPRQNTFRILENYLLNPTTSGSDANKLTQFDKAFRVFDIGTVDEKQDGANTANAQLPSPTTFDMSAYLAEQQQMIMTALSKSLLLDSKSFIAATITALRQFPTGRGELELNLKRIKYGLLSFFDVHSQQLYTLSDYTIFYQKLFGHLEADSPQLLIVALMLVQSDETILEPLQLQIAQTSFPSHADSMTLLRRSAGVLLMTLTLPQMERMDALRALKPIDFEKAVQIIDKPVKGRQP